MFFIVFLPNSELHPRQKYTIATVVSLSYKKQTDPSDIHLILTYNLANPNVKGMLDTFWPIIKPWSIYLRREWLMAIDEENIF